MLRILDENQISYSKDITKIITHLGLTGTAEYFINTLGLQMEKEGLMLLMKEYMLDAYSYTIPAKANVISVLIELKKKGASLNILTASPHITIDACLKRLGMWEMFDNIWSCDDFLRPRQIRKFMRWLHKDCTPSWKTFCFLTITCMLTLWQNPQVYGSAACMTICQRIMWSK